MLSRDTQILSVCLLQSKLIIINNIVCPYGMYGMVRFLAVQPVVHIFVHSESFDISQRPTVHSCHY